LREDFTGRRSTSTPPSGPLRTTNPQNAVVYGSGIIPITKMVRSGIAFDIIGLVLIVLLIPVLATLIIS
jgi:sodium-dependent dicarboxylate transporter 2/3/5